MSEPTKEQLAQQVEELQEKLAQRDALLEAQDSQLKTLHARGEGWLITAPNPLYNGQTYGVPFVNGQAFLTRTQRVAAFEAEPMKDGALEKYLLGQYPVPQDASDELKKEILARRDRERKAIREREHITSSERAAMDFKASGNYRVEYFDASRLLELEQVFAARASQAAEMAEMLRARQQAEMVGGAYPPGYTGR